MRTVLVCTAELMRVLPLVAMTAHVIEYVSLDVISAEFFRSCMFDSRDLKHTMTVHVYVIVYVIEDVSLRRDIL